VIVSILVPRWSCTSLVFGSPNSERSTTSRNGLHFRASPRAACLVVGAGFAIWAPQIFYSCVAASSAVRISVTCWLTCREFQTMLERVRKNSARIGWPCRSSLSSPRSWLLLRADVGSLARRRRDFVGMTLSGSRPDLGPFRCRHYK